MVDMQTAEKALKTVYLGVITEQLNTGVSPLMAKIEKTSRDVYGKEIVKAVTYGVNGGVGAGSETGVLPKSNGNNYANFRLELKNLFGTIEISDKAIRASQQSVGAFVNLLNAEMEGLLASSKFNMSRMLLGDGSGRISRIVDNPLNSDKTIIKVESVRGLAEGMHLDFFNAAGTPIANMAARKIVYVDRAAKQIKIEGSVATTLGVTDYFTVQNSKDKEITGLGALFNNSSTLYGLDRNAHKWLKPYNEVGGLMGSDKLQSLIENVEDLSGYTPNLLVCGTETKRYYVDYLLSKGANIDTTMIEGYKCLAFDGIPMFADRFANTRDMFALRTDDFKMYQLCDWRWLEGDSGNILRQNSNTATYNATLVKYAELLCERPCAQGKLSDFSEI